MEKQKSNKTWGFYLKVKVRTLAHYSRKLIEPAQKMKLAPFMLIHALIFKCYCIFHIIIAFIVHGTIPLLDRKLWEGTIYFIMHNVCNMWAVQPRADELHFITHYSYLDPCAHIVLN